MNPIDARDAMCRMCKYHERTTLFELCKHHLSKYTADGREGYHTIGHMRTVGPCHTEANLLERKYE